MEYLQVYTGGKCNAHTSMCVCVFVRAYKILKKNIMIESFITHNFHFFSRNTNLRQSLEISWSISHRMRELDNSVKWPGRYRLQSRTGVLLQAIAVALQRAENPLQLTWLFNGALVVYPQCLFAIRSLPVLCAFLYTHVHV